MRLRKLPGYLNRCRLARRRSSWVLRASCNPAVLLRRLLSPNKGPPVINRTFPEFWERYDQLPPALQSPAKQAFRRFRRDPYHPLLRFKSLHGHPNAWSVRIGLHYRAVGLRSGDTLRRFWIGTHAQFDKEFS